MSERERRKRIRTSRKVIDIKQLNEYQRRLTRRKFGGKKQKQRQTLHVLHLMKVNFDSIRTLRDSVKLIVYIYSGSSSVKRDSDSQTVAFTFRRTTKVRTHHKRIRAFFPYSYVISGILIFDTLYVDSLNLLKHRKRHPSVGVPGTSGFV